MYAPAHFDEQRPSVLEALMRAAPLANLVTLTESGLEANLLPLHLRRTEQGLTLVGHVARANPIWKRPIPADALAIFTGPHAYISPSAYPSKREHGKVVPTWNYLTVHAHGPLRWIQDEPWLAQLLEDLTNEHEASRPQPWSLSDAPADFTRGLLRAIVGFELRVTRLEGKFKLSQNRNPADRAAVIADLRARGDDISTALAEAMQTALDP